MESPQAKEAGADVGVEILVRAPRALGVVEMDRPQIGQADGIVEVREGGREGGRGAQVVAGGEGVACVEADADAGLVCDLVDDGAEIGEGAAEGVAAVVGGRRHVFEERHDVVGLGVGGVEAGGEAGERLGAGRPVGVARMEVVEADAEAFAAPEVVHERGVGLRAFGVVGVGQVDEVAAVRDDHAGRVVSLVVASVGERMGVFVLERRVLPLPLGLEETGECVGADVESVGDGVVDAAGGGDVRAEARVRGARARCEGGHGGGFLGRGLAFAWGGLFHRRRVIGGFEFGGVGALEGFLGFLGCGFAGVVGGWWWWRGEA